jgi:hypothetical protein
VAAAHHRQADAAQPIIATAGMGRVFWPRAAWVPELQRQCLVFPAGSPDDGVDTLGLLGRLGPAFGAGGGNAAAHGQPLRPAVESLLTGDHDDS